MKTLKELDELVLNIQSSITNQETKTQKKLVKIYDKIKKIYKEYQEDVEELRIDNASVDEKDILIIDEKGNYKFTKENLKKFKKEVKTLGEKKFDYKPIEVVNPKGLEEFSFLKGWVTGVKFEEEEEL